MKSVKLVAFLIMVALLLSAPAQAKTPYKPLPQWLSEQFSGLASSISGFAIFSESGTKIIVSTSGEGYVTSSPSGIWCGAACEESYNAGTEITLTAVPSSGASFIEWQGACTGTQTTCTTILDSSKTVKAVFSGSGGSTQKLRLIKEGDGNGNVLSEPDGIECTRICGSDSYGFVNGATVKLTATPFDGNAFAGWGGDCSGTQSTCTLTMDAPKTVTAKFSQKQAPVQPKKAETPAAEKPKGPTKQVKPSAITTRGAGNPSPGNSNEGRPVGVSTTAKVTIEVKGNGAVVPWPTGQECTTGTCSYEFQRGAAVGFTAKPSQGSRFLDWEGGLCGTYHPTNISCTFNAGGAVQGDKITANFLGNPPYKLTVYARYSGSSNVPIGTAKVVSADGKISCPPTCSAEYNAVDIIELQAISGQTLPRQDNYSEIYTFNYWYEGCVSANPKCTLVMDRDRKANAGFVYGLNRTKGPYSLHAKPLDPGMGKIVSDDINPYSKKPNIDCGCEQKCHDLGCYWPCSEDYDCGASAPLYPKGSKVNLTAKPIIRGPDQRYFIGWVEYVGDFVKGNRAATKECRHRVSKCEIVMNGDKSFEAIFAYKPEVTLTVRKSGSGTGTVKSSDSAINCGSQCTAKNPPQLRPRLTTLAAEDSIFSKWVGNNSCASDFFNVQPECDLVLYTDITVEAVFQKANRLQVYTEGGGSGTIKSSDMQINCGAKCSAKNDKTNYFNLLALPNAGSEFKGWKGACTGTGSGCSVSILNGTRNVTARFSSLPPYRLVVSVTGSGDVTSSNGAISCGNSGNNCAAVYEDNAATKTVTLTAKAAGGKRGGSSFLGWSGCDAVSGNTCTVTMDDSKRVHASFGSGQRGRPGGRPVGG